MQIIIIIHPNYKMAIIIILMVIIKQNYLLFYITNSYVTIINYY